MSKEELVYLLPRFLSEVKKMNGEDYPGKTLYELLLSIQMHMETVGGSFKLIDDPEFIKVKNTLDTLMKQRASLGIGTTVKKAEVISKEEEDILWNTGVLGSETPAQLLDTLVYLLGLHFALGAGKVTGSYVGSIRNYRLEPIQMDLNFCGTQRTYLKIDKAALSRTIYAQKL